MQLLPWTISMMQVQGRFRSDINFAIDEKFRKNHIVIPFPQRDLHLKSGFREEQKMQSDKKHKANSQF
jgi:small-conductance mechanosensitive channel